MNTLTENQVLIENFQYTKNATFTKIYVNGKYICYLLQDTLRAWGIKVYGETGIPVGNGKLKIHKSPKFGLCPYLYNQNDGKTWKSGGISFVNLRIHKGNKVNESLGCPMTGSEVDFKNERTIDSKTAFDKLMNHLDPTIEYDVIVKNHGQKA